MTQSTMGLRFESDGPNKLSLIRVEGRVTDDSLAELYEANRTHSAATDAHAAIVDLSLVSKIEASSASVRRLASRNSAAAGAKHLCIIVASGDHAFGLCRMFQILGEKTRPLLQIVHTMEEAFAAVGIPSPHFGPSLCGGDLLTREQGQ